MNDQTPWRLEGEYLESCNCAILCPCIIGPRSETGGPLAEPTEGHCDVPMVFRIDEGNYGAVTLDGLHAAYAIYTPGAMGIGGWTVGVYVDKEGNAEQRDALESIFSGQAGGPMQRFGAAVATWLPTETTAIGFEANGLVRRGTIPDVLDIEVEAIVGGGGSETWLDNVLHPVSNRLAIARTVKGFFKNSAFDWDNTGRNAHYSAFSWQGP